MADAPFELTAIAEEYLRNALAHEKPNMEPALVWIPGPEWAVDRAHSLCFVLESPRLALGWYHAGHRPRDSFYSLCGFEVSLMETTLEHIRGKTIDYDEVEMVFEGPQHKIKRLFIA